MPLTVFPPRWPAGRLIRALYNLAAITSSGCVLMLSLSSLAVLYHCIFSESLSDHESAIISKSI